MNPDTTPQNPTEGVTEMTPVQRIRNDWRTIVARVSYGAMVKNIPFFAFIALLGIVYISSNSSAIETQRAIEKQQVILQELRWKYMDAKTSLMSAGVEAEVIRRASTIGLKPLMLPAYKVSAGKTPANEKLPSQP
jgi:hypothetical protein